MSLASIQKIHSIQPHPNADLLDVAKVLDWPVVIKKGQFSNNELVIFIEIDSIVPKDNPYFSFMEKMHYRVWNARFRKAPSSGLVCPLSIIPPGDWKEGDDCTDILGIKKYERNEMGPTSADAKGNFPSHLISITDEINLRGVSKALIELEGKEVYESVKYDGSSVTIIYNNGEFLACSRRLTMKDGSGFPWVIVNKYNIQEKLTKLGKNIAIQLETIGPRMNGNRLELEEIECRVFRAKDLDTREIYSLDQLIELCNQLELPMVTVIDRFIFNSSIHTVDYFQSIADNLKYPCGSPAEGVVLAPTTPFYSDKLQKSWSAKIINQDYKQS